MKSLQPQPVVQCNIRSHYNVTIHGLGQFPRKIDENNVA